MPEKKQRLPLAILWWEVLATSIISWIVKKFLDLFWEKGKAEIKARRFNVPSPFQLLSKFWMKMYLPTIASVKTMNDPLFQSPESSRIIRYFLGTHRHLHDQGVYKAEKCVYCKVIIAKRKLLEKVEVNPKLYPPFSKK